MDWPRTLEALAAVLTALAAVIAALAAWKRRCRRGMERRQRPEEGAGERDSPHDTPA